MSAPRMSSTQWLRELGRVDDGAALHLLVKASIGIVPAPEAAARMSDVGRFVAGQVVAAIAAESNRLQLVKAEN